MKGCKVEGSTFISVDTIWSILETHLLKLIRVDAFYTISDPQLFKMCAKIDPKWLMGTSNWSHWRSKWFRWSQVDPRGAQVRPKGGQGTPRWSQEKPHGDPKGAQDDPKGSPRGAQSEPKRFTKGEGGCPRAPKHENVDGAKSLKNHLFLPQKWRSWSTFWAMLAHVGSSWVHVGAFWVIIGPWWINMGSSLLILDHLWGSGAKKWIFLEPQVYDNSKNIQKPV